MKRFALLFAFLSAAPALAQSRIVVKTDTGVALSAAVPSSATAGVDLSDALGFAVVVSAESTRTITGGSLLCYWYAPVANSAGVITYRWTQCATGLDFTPRTGARDAVSLGYEVPVGVSRVYFRTSSITVSGGTTVDVTLVVVRRK